MKGSNGRETIPYFVPPLIFKPPGILMIREKQSDPMFIAFFAQVLTALEDTTEMYFYPKDEIKARCNALESGWTVTDDCYNVSLAGPPYPMAASIKISINEPYPVECLKPLFFITAISIMDIDQQYRELTCCRIQQI